MWVIDGGDNAAKIVTVSGDSAAVVTIDNSLNSPTTSALAFGDASRDVDTSEADRRRALLQYKLIPAHAKVLVEEREGSGEATIECQITDGCTCIEWRIGKTGFFGFLQEDKNADGALLVRRPDGSFEAHVIECKRSVDQTSSPGWTTTSIWPVSSTLSAT